MPLLSQPFFQITLPIMVTFVVTVWAATYLSNRRIDELAKRLDGRMDDIIARLGRIETLLMAHESRISALEGAKWSR